MFLRLTPSSSHPFRHLFSQNHGSRLQIVSIRTLSTRTESCRVLLSSLAPRTHARSARLTSAPCLARASTRFLSSQPSKDNKGALNDQDKPKPTSVIAPSLRENIYTIPNALTLSRIISCPFLAWSILEGNFAVATGILAYAGISDSVSSLVLIRL